MKKLIALLAFTAITITSKAQISCSAFRISADAEHYTVSNAFDTTYVRHLNFDLSDTVNLSKIVYSLSDKASSQVLSTQTYPYTQADASDMSVANAYMRNNKSITISLGKLSYGTRYRVTIKLLDLQNHEISSSDFEF